MVTAPKPPLESDSLSSVSSSIKNPLDALYKNTSTLHMKFPEEFSATELHHYIQFMPVKYSRANRKVNHKKTINAIITLPIPGNLATSYKADWGEETLGQIGDVLADNAGFKETLRNTLRGDVDGIQKSFNEAIKQDNGKTIKAGKTTIARNIISSLSNFTNVKATQAGQLALGATVNPHLATLFTGVGFRNHQFQYKFVAKSLQESQSIENILRTFRWSMHPSINVAGFETGTVFSFPDEWLIQLGSTVRDNLYSFMPCVLTEFSVNYNGQGIPKFFKTGHPVDIQINMSFKETEVITRERLEDEFSGKGFGHKSQNIQSRDLNKSLNEPFDNLFPSG